MARWAALTVLAAAGVTAVGGPASSAAVVPVRVEVDDLPVALSPPPAVLDGVLYLPLRPLARTFGAELVVDGQTVTVRRPDGAVFVLRSGRREVWSAELVWALASSPARVVNGVFLVPLEMVEALFDVLAVWDPQAQVLRITTSRSVRVEQVERPAPAAPPAPPVPPFTPEFTPQDAPPLVASGYISLGVAVGAPEASAVSTVRFSTGEGESRVEGTVVMSARSGSLQTTGTVRLRGPTSLLTVGTVTFHDSPLTLYQQQLTGALYEGPLGPVHSAVVAGGLPSGGAVYGMVAEARPSWPGTMGLAIFSDPSTGALVSRLRAGRGWAEWEVFGEYAVGTAGTASGAAWRVGVARSGPHLSGVLSYLWLDAAYPALGNASLFSGRSGPLLELAYRPSHRLLLLGHAAALSGAPSGLPDRLSYAVLATYTPAVGSTATGEVRLTDDIAPGVWTRTVSAAGSLAWTWGRVGLVAGASHVLSEDRLTGFLAQTTTVALRAGVQPPAGVPTWVEVSRSFGSAESWSLALSTGIRLAAGDDLVARARRTWSVVTDAEDTWLEAGVSRLLPTGAALTAGAGVRWGTSAGPTPYVTLQYGVPVHLYGVPRVGAVEVEAFVDVDGDGLRGPDEPGVAGVVVRVDGRSAARTDGAGRAAVSGVPDGDHMVAVDDATVPAGLVAAVAEQRVSVRTGGRAAAAFPLRPAASVSGRVFLDDNDNGLPDPGERGLEGVVVTLLPGGLTRTTGPGGAFAFDGLLPGGYQVAVDSQSLPAGLAAGPAVEVTAVPGAEASVVLAVRTALPIIKKTFP
ncbi:MAG: SdrD B-like domain-containing protein [Armatimonadota bacterium]|nr:SdrD B-like domain-containing protein [Armatimonadota bacterium]MDR7403274.1 SdrD B-like domain-containing protein [Armatimonadota bacterium]